MESDRFLTGVNYWPRRKAMYWWSAFDSDEVAEEFDVIASLGMDVVRIFLLWDDWQEDPTTVAPARLRDLGTVCDIAAARDLGLDVTFFTGHMSGPSWSPRWMLDPEADRHASPDVRQVVSGGKVVDVPYRNMFHDPTALGAQRLLLETVVGEFRDHEAIWMWNLGNEPDLFARPTSAAAGAKWATEMSDLVRSIDPAHPVTTGLHTANLFSDNGLRVDDVFAASDIAVMHGYPMYIPWARNELDPDFVPFLCALTSALSGKPCLAEEWGGCTAPVGGTVIWEWASYGKERTQYMADEEAFAEYVRATLPRLVEVGATGAFLWCFADYATDLWGRPPLEDTGAKHERHFGLVRPDGSLKPHAEVIRDFAATGPMVLDSPARTVELDVTPDEFYRDPASHAQRLYESF